MEFTTQKKVILGSLIVFVAASIVGVYLLQNRADRAANDQAAKIFASTGETPTYTDIFGNPVALEDYLGSTVVATTWASWSPFSAFDLAKLNTLAESYADSGVVFLAINRKETREQAQRYVATLPELPNLVLVIDSEDKFYGLVGGYAMPETVIFNQAGEIVSHIRGELSVEVVTSVLENARE